MKITKYLLLFFLMLFVPACGKKTSDNPRGCVTYFIVSIEQHDMNKAWDYLGSDAQAFYNDLGDKMRKSGKGAFENEINRIKSFRNARSDYSIRSDKENPNNMHLITAGGIDLLVETVEVNGNFKIKNSASVKSVLSSIAGEVDKSAPY
jgi:hypothetical protein